MDQGSRSKRSHTPTLMMDSMEHRRSKRYKSPSPKRKYRRSRSRSDSRSKEMPSRERKTVSQKPTEMSAGKQISSPKAAPPVAAYRPQISVTQAQSMPQMYYGQTAYGNYAYTYGQAYDHATYQRQAGTFPTEYVQPNWQGNLSYAAQQQHMPVATHEAPVKIDNSSVGQMPPEENKKEAVAAELKQQKATLTKQRDEYIKKSTTLQRELEILRKQCEEIGKEGGRDNNRIIKENQKLQIEIQTKMKSIHNVIDMLTGIIGDKVSLASNDEKMRNRVEVMKQQMMKAREKSPPPPPSQPQQAQKEVVEPDSTKPLYNFVHYDPEMHWCRTCDVFPKTAKEYLNHLHSAEHRAVCLDRKIVDMPWHDVSKDAMEKEPPYYPSLPTKRTPIKGLQFFSPTSAWYCKLCSIWIGDLHCASLHLKSRRHSENFALFIEQNPHWETDWMADREKAFSDNKNKQIQMELQKHKEEMPVKVKKPKKNKKSRRKGKKRKKSSNSESSSNSDNSESDASDVDRSSSIRVAMRNKAKPPEPTNPPTGWNQKPAKDTDTLPRPKETNDVDYKADKRPKIKENEPPPVAKQEMNNYNPSYYYNKPAAPLQQQSTGYGMAPAPQNNDESKKEIKRVPPKEPPPEMPKPHMGFWTKQQVGTAKTEPMKIERKEEKPERNYRRNESKFDKPESKFDRPDSKFDRPDSKFDRSDRHGKYGGRYEYRDDKYRDGKRKSPDRDRDYHGYRRRRSRTPSPKRGRWRDSPGRDKNRGDDSGDLNGSKKGSSRDDPSKKGGSSSKTRLPFIGRLPLLKKKDDPKGLDAKELNAIPYTQTKFEDTPKVSEDIINPPGVVHITKLATPMSAITNNVETAKKQMQILVAPPPPQLNEKNGGGQDQVVDMDIDDQNEDADQSTEKSPTKSTVLPNMSLPPPGYEKALKKPPPSGFNPTIGPPPPFLMNAIINPNSTEQAMNHMQQMPEAGYMHPGQMPGPMMPNPMHCMVPPTENPTEVPVGKDGEPLSADLQEALDIIFPSDGPPGDHEVNTVMYGSMYSMLGCVGYGPNYVDIPPLEITQQSEAEPEAGGPDDLAMLGIDEGDTII